MTDIMIMEARMPKPATCKCGRISSPNDLVSGDGRIKIVCSACHGSILEIEYELPETGECYDHDQRSSKDNGLQKSA